MHGMYGTEGRRRQRERQELFEGVFYSWAGAVLPLLILREHLETNGLAVSIFTSRSQVLGKGKTMGVSDKPIARTVLAIGSKVLLHDDLVGRILEVCIREHGEQYRVSWWSNNVRNAEWLESSELITDAGSQKTEIGFR